MTSRKKGFTFNQENAKRVKEILRKYPANRTESAIMPLLHLAQEQNDNWVSLDVMDYIASLVGVPSMKVYEIANFYTMYNTKKVGKHLIQVCRTAPCCLRGSNEILQTCKDYLGIDLDDTTVDGMFTLKEVECLGACVNAPVVQINNDYYEDLSEPTITTILEQLGQGQQPESGSALGRQCSAPLTEDKEK